MSIDKLQPDTLIEQAALSQLREQVPVDDNRLDTAAASADSISDEGARAADAAGLTDAVVAETTTSAPRDSGDQLLASDAWQGIPADARNLPDASAPLTSAADERSGSNGTARPGDATQTLDAAVAFVIGSTS